jgi:hypothetical protein
MSSEKDSGRPEPVLDEAKIAGFVTAGLTAVLTVAVVLGFVAQEDTNTLVTTVVGIVGGVVTLVNFVVPKWRAWRARKQVTPLSDPRTVGGIPLVPARQ